MTRFPLLSILLVVACGRSSAPTPPAAEFLVVAGDSTYWVAGASDGVRLRGSPILLAHVDGRFHEIYVADDDRSYRNAVIIGQRIYRRDLLTGDSVLVYEDGAIPEIAIRYAKAHPDERPLGPDDEAAEEPETIATAELEFLELHGPYLSFQAHTDIDIVGEEDAHSVRRGVLDLRTGKQETLRALFGDRESETLIVRGRAAFAAALDSVLAARGESARRAARTIGDFEFDGSSFVLSNVGRSPRVAFLVPGQRQRAGGLGLALPPLPVAPPTWWRAIESSLPEPDGADTDRWNRPSYGVLARYSAAGDSVTLVLTDTTSRQWEVGVLSAPAYRIHWLDVPAIDSLQRRALARAFDEAALYSDDARIARLRIGDGRPRLVSVALAFSSRPPNPARHRRSHRRQHSP